MAERNFEVRVQELMCYLWDNYIQLYGDAEIFLLGVGNAHVGVKALLTCRGESINILTLSFRPSRPPIQLQSHAH